MFETLKFVIRLQARHKKQMSTINIISIERMIRLIQEVMKGNIIFHSSAGEESNL